MAKLLRRVKKEDAIRHSSNEVPMAKSDRREMSILTEHQENEAKQRKARQMRWKSISARARPTLNAIKATSAQPHIPAVARKTDEEWETVKALVQRIGVSIETLLSLLSNAGLDKTHYSVLYPDDKAALAEYLRQVRVAEEFVASRRLEKSHRVDQASIRLAPVPDLSVIPGKGFIRELRKWCIPESNFELSRFEELALSALKQAFNGDASRAAYIVWALANDEIKAGLIDWFNSFGVRFRICETPEYDPDFDEFSIYDPDLTNSEKTAPGLVAELFADPNSIGTVLEIAKNTSIKRFDLKTDHSAFERNLHEATVRALYNAYKIGDTTLAQCLTYSCDIGLATNSTRIRRWFEAFGLVETYITGAMGSSMLVTVSVQEYDKLLDKSKQIIIPLRNPISERLFDAITREGLTHRKPVGNNAPSELSEVTTKQLTPFTAGTGEGKTLPISSERLAWEEALRISEEESELHDEPAPQIALDQLPQDISSYKPMGADRPKASAISTTQYLRDLAVKAWVLKVAGGYCDCCKNPAPFRCPDNAPYLEVHHVIPLSEGGADTYPQSSRLADGERIEFPCVDVAVGTGARTARNSHPDWNRDPALVRKGRELFNYFGMFHGNHSFIKWCHSFAYRVTRKNRYDSRVKIRPRVALPLWFCAPLVALFRASRRQWGGNGFLSPGQPSCVDSP